MTDNLSDELLYQQIEDHNFLIAPIRELIDKHYGDLSISKIYHYTKPDGLLGILKSKCIRATDYRFLNDKSELMIARELANDVLLSKLKNNEIAQEFYVTLKRAIDYLDGMSFFIISFTEEPNLLSQWRAYANPQGYSIGIKYELGAYISTFLKEYSLFLKCIYSKKDQENIVKVAIEALRDKWKQKGEDIEYLKKIERAFVDFIAVASCFFKHEGFSEEKEWRLAIFIENIHQYDPDELGLHFRSTTSGIIPYMEVPLTYLKFDLSGNNKHNAESRFELEDIIIGPSGDADHQLRALELLVKQLNVGVKNIQTSNIPLKV